MIDVAALNKIQYGMYVITTSYEGQANGQIATVLFQVTAAPAQIAIALSKNTYTHELIAKSKVFGASILSEEVPTLVIGTFGYKSGRDGDKFQGVNYVTKLTGCPLVTDYTLAIMEAEVVTTLDVGTHTILVGKLLSSQKICDGVAMTYEYYHTVRKGKSPVNAPTYQGLASSK